MSYNDNLKQQLNSLKIEIKNCKDEEFDNLVYKYNFYKLVENTLENEMIEGNKYNEILSKDKDILNKLYNKFMGLVNAPSMVDETVLEEFLKEIELENKNIIVNMKLIDKIADVFGDYYTENYSKSDLKENIIKEVSENKIPYKVLQHLYNLYEDSLPRCEEQYIEKIRNILYEAEDYYFGNEYSRETIKYLIYQDTYLEVYKEYKDLKKVIEKFNNSNEKGQEEIVENTLKIKYSIFKEDLKQRNTLICNPSSTMSVEKDINEKLVLIDLIDIYNGTQLIESKMNLNRFLNIVGDIIVFKDIEELINEVDTENRENIFNKIQHLKEEFKEFKLSDELPEEEEVEGI